MREPKTLLTYSLISAWQWALNERSGESGYSDFLRTLNREPKTDYTESQIKGIEFENAVYNIVSGMPVDNVYGDEYDCEHQGLH